MPNGECNFTSGKVYLKALKWKGGLKLKLEHLYVEQTHIS